MILLQIFNNSLYHHVQLDFQNTARGSKKWITLTQEGTNDGFWNMTMNVSVPKNIKYFGHFSNRRLFKKLPKPWSWVVDS